MAEDNEMIRDVCNDFIKRSGYDLDMVSNGLEAVEYAVENEGKYDLCIMDIDMPIMNGFEATAIIRRKLKYIPIMAFSGNRLHRGKSFEIGMDDFLEKPCIPSELLVKINELTIKSEKVETKSNHIFIKKEMPMDAEHAKELRELAKKNLRKVKLFDSPGSTVIVHKNVTNKISHDFNIQKQVVTTFLNRDSDKPTRCELYKNTNYLMPQVFLLEEEYNDIEKEEDQELEKFPILQLIEDE